MTLQLPDSLLPTGGLQSGDATPGLGLNALLWVGSTHMNSYFWTQSWKTLAQEKESSSSDTTHTHKHTHKREIETTVHTEEERERERERKWLGKQCCKQKTKAPCFRQQNPTWPTPSKPTPQCKCHSVTTNGWIKWMNSIQFPSFHPSIHPSIHSFISHNLLIS